METREALVEGTVGTPEGDDLGDRPMLCTRSETTADCPPQSVCNMASPRSDLTQARMGAAGLGHSSALERL